MADDRSPEQITADAKLEHAIGECAKAYGYIGEGQAVGDWLCYVEVTSFDQALAGRTRYVVLLPGSEGIPWHRILGLHVLAGKELDDQRNEDREE